MLNFDKTVKSENFWSEPATLYTENNYNQGTSKSRTPSKTRNSQIHSFWYIFNPWWILTEICQNCQFCENHTFCQFSCQKWKFLIKNFTNMSTFVDDSVELWPHLKSHPENTKNTKFLINFDAQKSTQLFEIRTKNPKIDKFLNHVFKTSKKTLSYSRTYCKIYKIENIGKIGQSRMGL